MPAAADGTILVKRYAGRRLYDTVAGRYVSAAQLQAWRAAGIAFAVMDAETGLEITAALAA